MTSPFSDSIVFTVHTRKQRFQKASFSNRFTLESVFEWRFRMAFRRCSVDDSRIRSKTAPFLFENGLVWTGPNMTYELLAGEAKNSFV